MPKMRNLPEGLHHLLYEVEMAATAVLQLMQGTRKPLMKSVWTEILALHIRNLNDFFGEVRRHSNDMQPQDLVVGWKSEYFFNKKIFVRASQEIMHLTFDRKVPDKREHWDIVCCFKPILTESLSFLDAIKGSSSELLAFSDNRARFKAIYKNLREIKEEFSNRSQAGTPAVSGATGPAYENETLSVLHSS